MRLVHRPFEPRDIRKVRQLRGMRVRCQKRRELVAVDIEIAAGRRIRGDEGVDGRVEKRRARELAHDAVRGAERVAIVGENRIADTQRCVGPARAPDRARLRRIAVAVQAATASRASRTACAVAASRCEHVERRDVRVPLDQRRHAAEARHGGFEQRPHFRCDRRAMRIDHDRPGGVEAGEVDFRHGCRRNGGEIGQRIDTMVACIDVDVVDVDQQPAAGARGDRRHELVLGDRRFREREIARHVLHEQLAAEKVLHGRHAHAHVIERLLGIRQRQQVVEVPAGDAAPAQVFGNRGGRDAIGEPLELGAGAHGPADRLNRATGRRRASRADSRSRIRSSVASAGPPSAK